PGPSSNSAPFGDGGGNPVVVQVEAGKPDAARPDATPSDFDEMCGTSGFCGDSDPDDPVACKNFVGDPMHPVPDAGRDSRRGSPGLTSPAPEPGETDGPDKDAGIDGSRDGATLKEDLYDGTGVPTLLPDAGLPPSTGGARKYGCQVGSDDNGRPFYRCLVAGE